MRFVRCQLSVSIIKVKAQANAPRREWSSARGVFCFFICVLLTTPFKETCAGRADEAEKRHPDEDQSDEGGDNHDDNEFVGHVQFLLNFFGIFCRTSRGGSGIRL